MKCTALVAILVFLGTIESQFVDASEKSTLVLIDTLATKETHSMYFKALHDKGYQLTFKMSDDSNLSLKKYGQWLYENLIVFAPGTDEFGGSLNPEAIGEFVDNGGNVLVAGNSYVGQAIRDLAAEFGVELDEANSFVIDHFNYDSNLDAGRHTVLAVDPSNVIDAEIIGGRKGNQPILYQGSSLLVDPENPLVMEVLTASSSAYSYDPNKIITEYPHTVGKSSVLVAALQARNNARVVFSGSMDFFSDKFTSSVRTNKGESFEKSGNEQLVKSLNEWLFCENGVLRLTNVSHHKYGENLVPAFYTITDDVVYRVVIEELKNGAWVPYHSQDIQLEFVRIDPFIRMYLKRVPNENKKGLYEARFKLPDVYGVFQFKINYHRKGYTFLSSATQVSVRPLEHTQYERFIPGAYPYYLSAFSMMLGVLMFSIVFLHYKEKDKHE